ncbi:Putative glycosyltransferase EpsE, partial [Durusdinium trenchii]
EDILTYELDRSGEMPEWRFCKDSKGFKNAFEALPKDLQLLGLLKGHALMGDKLSWHAVQTTLERAVRADILTADQSERVQKDMMIRASESVRESRCIPELKELGLTLEDAIKEYLEREVVFTPLDVITECAVLDFLQVGDDASKYLKGEKPQ